MDPNLNTLPRPLKMRICRASSLKYKLLNSYFDSQQLLLCQTAVSEVQRYLADNIYAQGLFDLGALSLWVGWPQFGLHAFGRHTPFLSHGWDSLTAVNI